MTATDIDTEFPEFSAEMDGEAPETCIPFYWKYNKREEIYEFISLEAEEEIAEWMKVRLWGSTPTSPVANGDAVCEPMKNPALSVEQVADHKDILTAIHEGLKILNCGAEDEASEDGGSVINGDSP